MLSHALDAATAVGGNLRITCAIEVPPGQLSDPPGQRDNLGRFSAPVAFDTLRTTNHPGLTYMVDVVPPVHSVPSRHASHFQSFAGSSMIPLGCSGGSSIKGGIPFVWNSSRRHLQVAENVSDPPHVAYE